MKVNFVLLCLVAFLSCDSKKETCEEVACTEDFRTIMVSIKDDFGNAIALSSFKVTSTETGQNLTRTVSENELQAMQDSGNYPLFGDEYSSTYRNSSVSINFKGFINQQEIVNANFEVGADCCHVRLIEGNTEITLD